MQNKRSYFRQGTKCTPKVSYVCGVDLAHPNYPNEKTVFLVMKKVSGEPVLLLEEINVSNRGYEPEIKDRIEKTKKALMIKYPDIKFIVDRKYRTWSDDEPEKRF